MAELHGNGSMAVSIDGAEYRADGRGVITVPDSIAPRLAALFGFTPHAPNGEGEDGGGTQAAVQEAADYATWATPELVAEARRLGVDIPAGTVRKKLLALLSERAAQ
jgi:hypothetical protein